MYAHQSSLPVKEVYGIVCERNMASDIFVCLFVDSTVYSMHNGCISPGTVIPCAYMLAFS